MTMLVSILMSIAARKGERLEYPPFSSSAASSIEVPQVEASKGAARTAKVEHKEGKAAVKPKAKLSEITLSEQEETALINTAIEKMKEGLYSELDPVVGDSACQLTAFAVVSIARKLAFSSLSPDEMQFLRGNIVLQSARKRALDALDNGVKDERIEKVIPASLNPDLYNEKARVDFTIGEVHKFIDFRINYLMANLQAQAKVKTADPKLAELAVILANKENHHAIQRRTGVSGLHYDLTCFPCGATLEAILLSEFYGNHPILITVKRMMRTILGDNQKLALQAMETYMFKPNIKTGDFTFCASPSIAERSIPCVHIFGNSIVNRGESALPFLNTQSFAMYREDFLAGSIMDKLRLCYVAHSQYPGKPSMERQACYESEKATGMFASLYKGYKQRLAAGDCGIPENTMLYPTQKPGVLTSYEMTFAIDHIFADTFVNATAKCQEVMSLAKDKEITAEYSLSQ
jgi:hypothetical protein